MSKGPSIIDIFGLAVFPAAFLGPVAFYLLIRWHARRRLAEILGLPPELVTTRINRTFPKALIQAAEKIAREAPLPPDEPPLRNGDRCFLLGDLDVKGSGPLMVVETDATHVVVAWDNGCQELKMSRAIVRRVKGGELVRPTKVAV
jgi:hypothetical protein